MALRTEVGASHLSVTPGVPVVFDIEVTNTSEVIDGVTATISGLDPSWVQLVLPVVSLFPDSTATLSLRLSLPKDCLAGEYLVTARVVSVIDPDRSSEHEFWLSVEPLEQASMRLRPSLVVGRKHARFDAVVQNEGNVPIDFAVSVIDPTRLLTCRLEPAGVVVPAGESRFVELHVSGPRPWFANKVAREFTVHAAGTGPGSDETDLELDARGGFTQTPRIARGLVTFLILAMIVALWAGIFAFAAGLLGDKPPLTKEVGATFDTRGKSPAPAPVGEPVVPGAPVAPSVSQVPAIPAGTAAPGAAGSPAAGSPAAAPADAGATPAAAAGAQPMVFQVNLDSVGVAIAGSVTARANKEPLPRMVVQIFRIDPKTAVPLTKPGADGKPLPVPTASAATGDDGSYSFNNLLPGDYKLLVTGAGFVDQWSGGAPNLETATTVSLPTVARRAGEEAVPTVFPFVMDGQDGELSGSVIAPERKPGVEITVALSQAGDPTPDFTVPGPTSCTVDGPCDYTFPALPTPASYKLTFHSGGFDDRVVTQDLGAGQKLNLNTVTLGAAPGSIQGVVTSGGVPKGGVKVTVSSGQFTKTVTTPTSGAKTGTYIVEGLETPRTYVVTMALDGFEGQTQAIDLLPGAPQTVNGIVQGGIGTISGLVTDFGTPPAGLGGVKVVVSGGTFTAETATLTGGSGDPTNGTYTITGLPKAGRYTVTMSLDGFESETLVVQIGDTQPLQQDVQLKRSKATIDGAVKIAGAPASGVIVELSDGGKPRSTVTATNPVTNQAGYYIFPDVAPGTYTLTYTIAATSTTPARTRVLLISVVVGDVQTRNVDLPGV